MLLAACGATPDAPAPVAPAALPPVQEQDAGTRESVARMVGYFPNTSLTTHEGERVRFYDDLVRDKSVLINFMYATCDGI